MCGYHLTLWNREKQPDEATRQKKIMGALQAIEARGPDEKSAFLLKSEIDVCHARLVFSGSRRDPVEPNPGLIRELFLSPPGSGAQPFLFSDGSIGVMNGEYYGDDVGNGNDCQVLLHHVQRNGPKILNDLSFEGSGVLISSDGQTVTAFRDQFGIKPINWALTPRALLLSSAAKSFFYAGMIKPKLGAAMAWVLGEQYLPADQTIFENIFSVPPGGYVVFKKEDGRWRAHQKSFWLRRDKQIRTLIEQKDIDQLDEILNRAVKNRVERGGPIACHLSGGVDSSLIAALAKNYGGLDAYTVSFSKWGEKGRIYDESKVAIENSLQLGVNLKVITPSRQDILNAWGRACGDAEGVSINSHMAAKWIMHEAMRREGKRAVLSGEGADELFYGYTHLQRDYQQSGGQTIIPEHSALISHAMHPRSENLNSTNTRQGLATPSWLLAKHQQSKKWMELFSKEWISPQQTIALFSLGERFVYQSQQLWIERALAGYILHNLGDGTEACHGLEGRPPLLDREVDLWARQWSSQVMMKGIGKDPLRDVAKKYLPERIALNPKHPFEAPPLMNTKSVLDQILEVLSDPIVSDLFAPQISNVLLSKIDQASEHEPGVCLALSIAHLHHLCQTKWSEAYAKAN